MVKKLESKSGEPEREGKKLNTSIKITAENGKFFYKGCEVVFPEDDGTGDYYKGLQRIFDPPNTKSIFDFLEEAYQELKAGGRDCVEVWVPFVAVDGVEVQGEKFVKYFVNSGFRIPMSITLKDSEEEYNKGKFAINFQITLLAKGI